MKFPRYKVIGSPDGMGHGSKIIDLETGLPLGGVARITVTMIPNDASRALVELVGVVAEVPLLENEIYKTFAKIQTVPEEQPHVDSNPSDDRL